MRILVHVERVSTYTAEVWVEAADEMTHDELIEKAAEVAFDQEKWELDSYYISKGIASHIVKRESHVEPLPPRD